MQIASRHCGYCTTALSFDSPLVAPCSGNSSSATPCPFRFCNRLCLKRSRLTHPLICAAQNPASTPLLTFARKNEWLAVHALAQCTSRILLANQQQTDEELNADWDVIKGLAVLSMEDRFKDSGYDLFTKLTSVQANHMVSQAGAGSNNMEKMLPIIHASISRTQVLC